MVCYQSSLWGGCMIIAHPVDEEEQRTGERKTFHLEVGFLPVLSLGDRVLELGEKEALESMHQSSRQSGNIVDNLGRGAVINIGNALTIREVGGVIGVLRSLDRGLSAVLRWGGVDATVRSAEQEERVIYDDLVDLLIVVVVVLILQIRRRLACALRTPSGRFTRVRSIKTTLRWR